MRLRLDLGYDGTDFHGWAAQPGQRTVQGVLEPWIAQVLRLPSQPTLVVAGRTDAGVHARAQVCHVDLDVEADPSADLLRRLQRVLPHDIAVRSVAPAPEGFDARFSATWRRYCYRVSDEGTFHDPLLRGQVARLPFPLDIGALNSAAATVIGLRDFAAFCKPREGATTIRELREVSALRREDGVVEIWLQADAFCHSMVRSLAGALTAVGGSRRTLAWLEEVTASPRRHSEVPVMPANGLTLEGVGYPADEDLALRAEQARTVRTVEEA